MKELLERDLGTDNRKSSKGNQLKWSCDDIWYKADYTGYEGFAEYIISQLLKKSTLTADKYILYDTEEIGYKQVTYLGCRSKNFLPKGWQMFTLERLFQSIYGESLNKSIYTIRDITERVRFLVEQTIRITGLESFGEYMSVLLTIDAFFLNEDRHTHNIAVLLDDKKQYHYCPIFDNGAALLSDTTMDYPMGIDPESLLEKPKAKTFCTDFDEQLSAVERLYGKHVRFQFTAKDIRDLIQTEKYYPEDVKQRVQYLLLQQKRKYAYLFK